MWNVLRIALKLYKNFQKPNMIAKQENTSDCRCEGRNMAYKCKIYGAANLTLHGH